MNPTATLTPIRLRDRKTDATTDVPTVLADEVRDVLLECGFTTSEIRRWADIYTRRAGAGDADDFLDWISTYEHRW